MCSNTKAVVTKMKVILMLIVSAHVVWAGRTTLCQKVRDHKNLNLLPEDTQCGPMSVAPRTMFGNNARPGEFPWMAQLLTLPAQEGNKIEQFCDGTVINNKYIVTAAHCLSHNLKPADLTILLGTVYTNNQCPVHNKNCESKGVYYATEDIISHARFSGDDLITQNDIGLVRVQGEITFNEFVRPICLPTSCSLIKMHFNRIALEVMGWGDTEEVPKLNVTRTLQSAYVRGSNLKECNKLWTKVERVSIKPSQICTKGIHGESTCHGDSGGPLVYSVPETPVRNVLVGIVSLGEPCNPARPSIVPDVFTRVSSFMIWILDHIHE